MSDPAAADARGFSLLEVLVALAILAVSLTVLLSHFANGLHLVRESEDERTAGALAQSLLDRLGNDIPVRDGDLTGDSSGNFRWRLHVEPYGDEQEKAAWPVSAKAIAVTVSWPSNLGMRSLKLATLRLAPKEEAK